MKKYIIVIGNLQCHFAPPFGGMFFAKKIIEVGRQNGVPVIENPPVARAIFRMVEIDASIPPELYKAVAEILIFVLGHLLG